jgi:NB-ARC domain
MYIAGTGSVRAGERLTREGPGCQPSGDAEEDGEGAGDGEHGRVVEAAYGRADTVAADGHQLSTITCEGLACKMPASMLSDTTRHSEGSMTFLPLARMLDRVNRYGSDSESQLFTELLYAGEFIAKLTVSAFVAGVEDDRENHRYRLTHNLVRADGIGDWARTLDEVLTGPPSQHLAASFSQARQTFTQRLGQDEWQGESVLLLHKVLETIYSEAAPIGKRVALREWFQIFSELRNKTRGHGAPTPATCAALVPSFRNSVQLLADNNPIFKMPWAFLHRNLSGKYRVVKFSQEEPEPFKNLKSSAAITGEHHSDGVYISAERLRRVELVYTDLNADDFFFPNGAFKNSTYELHSLITDNRLRGDGAPYLATAGERPPSETEGLDQLDIVGRVFSNLPAMPESYVHRPALEKEVFSALSNDRHPIVTLVGRGGIGKTSLVLSVSRELAETSRYEAILWFSARDIDLTTLGAKPVQPRVLTEGDIARQYWDMFGDLESPTPKGRELTEYMARHLHKNPNGPTLFIFDNFETVRSPLDLFQWIDTNIRLPNKAVITTRFRDFKADFPIEVAGMERKEAERLVLQTAAFLGVSSILGTKEVESIIEESDGHPYVIKIMLGEIADARAFTKPGRIIARKEDILDALFERTYANLSPLAVRIYLTLSGWRSLVPQLAVEASCIRHGAVGINPQAGIDELVRMSLVERTTAPDGGDFLAVPLTAAIFGKRKLDVSPQKPVIEEDIKFIQDVGVTARTGTKDGIYPRIEALFKRNARRILEGGVDIETVIPVLEFIASSYPPAWRMLAYLVDEADADGGGHRATEYLRRYLETNPSEEAAAEAWQRLFALYKKSNDVIGAYGAFMSAAKIVHPEIDEISSITNYINHDNELISGRDPSERSALFMPLVVMFEEHLSEASATDLSRLSWLHLHCGNVSRALELAELGLDRDPSNVHCARIVAKLTDDVHLNVSGRRGSWQG